MIMVKLSCPSYSSCISKSLSICIELCHFLINNTHSTLKAPSCPRNKNILINASSQGCLHHLRSYSVETAVTYDVQCLLHRGCEQRKLCHFSGCLGNRDNMQVATKDVHLQNRDQPKIQKHIGEPFLPSFFRSFH